MFHLHEPAEDSAHVLPVGALLHKGRYRVDEVLGRGGFGITYAARDCEIGREVAIKEFFPPDCHREADRIVPQGSAEVWEHARQSFGLGARTMAKLRYASLLRVYDHFEENGTTYSVMERLHGSTLQQYLDVAPFPEDEAVHIIQQVAGALDAMHRMGLLHLDIKPENVMLCAGDEGRVVLFDFDLLQELDRVNAAHTRPLGAAYNGTPGYAPLEQYSQNAPLGMATDVYALGATFYALLTGSPPPSATDRALGAEFAAPRELLPQLGREHNAAALRALELQPADRLRRVSDFLDVLQGTASTVKKTSAVAPVAPHRAIALPQLGAGDWYVLTILTAEPQFPDICACCGATATKDWRLRGQGREWLIPYCSGCWRHARNDMLAEKGASWGMAGSLTAALVGVGMTLTEMSLVGLLLTPSAAVAFFTAMAYGVLKNQVADAQTRPDCSHRGLAVAYGKQTGPSGPHLWKFKSQAYALAFARENGSNVVPAK